MCAEENENTEQTPEAKPEEQAQATPLLPKPNLSALVHMFFMQGMIAAGKIPSPVTQKYEKDTNMAKYQVELLELIQEKTQNNRTEDEDKLIEEVLHNLRIAYVDISRQT